MSYYDVLPAPVQSPQIIEAVAGLLEADATLETALGGAGRLYQHHTPADPPEADGSISLEQWRRLVVREPRVPGDRAETGTRLDLVAVMVVAEIQAERLGEPTAVIRPEVWLPAVHDRVFSLLVGQTPAFGSGQHVLPLSRWSLPTPMAYDAGDDSFYSSAVYHAVVEPN